MGLELEELRSSDIAPERLRELSARYPSRVATHRSTPPELLAVLATNADDDTRWHVARRRQTPEAALVALTRDPVIRVRVAAFENEALADAVRATALHDPSDEVRASLAGSTTDLAVLETLAADPSPIVRAAVAGHPDCPAGVLERLAHDPDDEVRVAFANAAGATPEILETLVGDRSDLVAGIVAGRELSDSALRALAGHGAGAVREAVAGNAATPPDVLATLARDPAEGVRAAVVWHEAATEAILDGLARDPAEDVREAVARRGGTSVATLAHLARDPAPRVRVVVAADPHLDPGSLLVLATDGDDRVRARVRNHPSATADVKRAVDGEDAGRRSYVEERPPEEPIGRVSFGPFVPGSRSTVGGPAWLPVGLPWPTCRLCGQALTLFVQVRLDAVPRIRPGSQLSVFVCRTHDDVPSIVGVELDRPLPPDAWAQTAGHVHVRLDPPEVELVEVPSPSAGLRPASLVPVPATEVVTEAGPLRARFFVGEPGFKIGGVPAWLQGRESYPCFCGSRMRLVLQVPEGQMFATDEREILLFLGNGLYVFACEAQCSPLGVWPIVQG